MAMHEKREHGACGKADSVNRLFDDTEDSLQPVPRLRKTVKAKKEVHEPKQESGKDFSPSYGGLISVAVLALALIGGFAFHLEYQRAKRQEAKVAAEREKAAEAQAVAERKKVAEAQAAAEVKAAEALAEREKAVAEREKTVLAQEFAVGMWKLIANTAPGIPDNKVTTVNGQVAGNQSPMDRQKLAVNVPSASQKNAGNPNIASATPQPMTREQLSQVSPELLTRDQLSQLDQANRNALNRQRMEQQNRLKAQQMENERSANQFIQQRFGTGGPTMSEAQAGWEKVRPDRAQREEIRRNIERLEGRSR